MKKIDSIRFGGKMLLAALLLGAVIPGAIRLLTGKTLWGFCIAGGAVLLVFIGILVIERRQDDGKTPYYIRHMKDEIPFDPETQIPVIRSSVCTGEKVAGFRDKNTGKFIEAAVIRSEAEKKRFMEIYGIDEIGTEY